MKKRKSTPSQLSASKNLKGAKKAKPRAAASVNSEQVMQDYKIAYISRQASLLGRKEALTGKAKFGIFGDGK